MGNLAGLGGKPQPSQTRRDVEPPKPLASPTTRVDSHGSEQGVQALGVIGHSGGHSGGRSEDRSAGQSSGRPEISHPATTRPEPAPRTGSSASASEPAAAPRATVARAAAPGEPVPQAAPRTRVDSVGQAAPEGMREAPDPAETGLTAPAWVRSLIIGVLGSAFGLAGLTFWRSGRRPSRKRGIAERADAPDMRLEPSFDGGRSVAAGAPVLRATRPS
jgi:hypothetical protein